jgi:hypothetical protein
VIPRGLPARKHSSVLRGLLFLSGLALTCFTPWATPTLTIQTQNGQASEYLLTWDSADGSYLLEATERLEQRSTPWTPFRSNSTNGEVAALSSAVMTASDQHQFFRLRRANAPGLPADPATVASSLTTKALVNFVDATAFLYSASNPIQTGVREGVIQSHRAAVLRGQVKDRSGVPLPGATISILDHGEFGQTLSRIDGMFDLAVNGGTPLTLIYTKQGYLSAQRTVNIPGQDFALVPPVTLVQPDTNVTFVRMEADAPTQLARGTAQNDGDGRRQLTLLFPAGTKSSLVMPDGTRVPAASLHVRATEFTIGTDDSQMPGALPPASAYTYCVDLSADEAVATGAIRVEFDHPVSVCLENFLGFPTGTEIPMGYFDPQTSVWIPSANGRVIRVVDVANGRAQIDSDGDGKADAKFPLADDELEQLALLYPPGTSLWRTEIEHFSAWDKNWGFGPPPGAAPPGVPGPAPAPGGPAAPGARSPVFSALSRQSIRNQGSSNVLSFSIPIPGSDVSLNYNSGRVPGAKNAFTIFLTGTNLPASLKRVDLEVSLLGRQWTESFSTETNQSTIFVWDGKDPYGRFVPGRHDAIVRLGYVYDGVYQYVPRFGYNGNGIPITGSETRREVTLWKEWILPLRNFDARDQGLGGWTLNRQHAYDPRARVLYQGDGNIIDAKEFPAVITTFAGSTSDCFLHPELCAEGASALDHPLASPSGLVLDGENNLYIGSSYLFRIFKISGGKTTTFAGTGTNGFNGDNIPARTANLGGADGIALDAKGNMFVADTQNHRIRKIDRNGIITTVAGNGTECPNGTAMGDGGPALEAPLCNPIGVAVDSAGNIYFDDYEKIRKVDPSGVISTVVAGPYVSSPAVDLQGNLYYVDQFGGRLQKITPDGRITTVAGGNGEGSTGNGGPAEYAKLDALRFPSLDRAGNIYLPTYRDELRMVNPDGIITTLAGKFGRPHGGDGAPAVDAGILDPASVVVDPEGNIYVSEFWGGGPGYIRKISPALPGISGTDIAVPSRDRSTIFIFDSRGRHKEIRAANSNALIEHFTYNTFGQLTNVFESDGKGITIELDATGQPHAIVSSNGQRTELTLDANGYLSSVSTPDTKTYNFSSTPTGLISRSTDANGQIQNYHYDRVGLLIQE